MSHTEVEVIKRSGKKVQKACLAWLFENTELFPNGTTMTTKQLRLILLENEVLTNAECGGGLAGDVLEKAVGARWVTRIGGNAKKTGLDKGTKEVIYTFARPLPVFETPEPLLEETEELLTISEEGSYHLLRQELFAVRQMLELLLAKAGIPKPGSQGLNLFVEENRMVVKVKDRQDLKGLIFHKK